MKRRTNRFTVSVLLAAVLLVLANGFVANYSVEQLLESQHWVTHTWQVLHELDNLTGSLRGAESATRGYLLVGDEGFLLPLYAAEKSTPANLNLLRQLTRDNPRQQQNLSRLEALAKTRLQLLHQSIDARREGQAVNARVLALCVQGEDSMDQMREVQEAFQEEENRLLELRMQDTAAARLRSQGAILLASGMDLLLLLLALRFMFRERRLRTESEEIRTRLEKLLSISDIALTQLTLSELTQALLARARKVLDSDSALLCLMHEMEVEIAAADGIELPVGQRIRILPNGPIARSVKEQKIVVLSETLVETIPIQALRKEMHNILLIPCYSNHAPIGVLIMGRKDVRVFEEYDEQLLSFVADRIGVALDRASAYEAEREARKVAEESAEQIQVLNSDLENRVRIRTSELEASNQELEAFSYSVSHDLRAPLRTIDGFSLALSEDYHDLLDETGRDYLSRIRSGVQRMGTLIDSLLQLSRVTRAELLREELDLSALARDVAMQLKEQNPERAIVFDIEPGLTAMGDARLLRVALENLLGNAVKFTGKTPAAQIAFGFDKKAQTYFIRDNGAGFDMQYADKLFIAFQRLHGDKDFKGSGIGLATVGRIIRRHHGMLSAEGKVGEGAVFYFTLG